MADDLWTRFHFRGKDLRGQKFARLTVIDMAKIHRSPSGAAVAYWLCRCECGTEKAFSRSTLGKTVFSCGCWQRERMGKLRYKHGLSVKTAPHPVYKAWSSMLSRCTNPKRPDYHNYGGRGITVCERWRAFENFRDDMLPSWQPGLTLDREDNEKGYCPENCRWATHIQQCNNTRHNRRLTIDGVTKTMSEWADVYGINRRTVFSRLNITGWSEMEALTTPARVYFKAGGLTAPTDR